MKNKSYFVSTTRATGCVTVCGNKIVETPPIWKGWKNRAWSSFKAYYKPEVITEIPEKDWLKNITGKWPGDETIEELLKGEE